MTSRMKGALAVLVALVGTAVLVSAAFAGSTATPGVTKTTITIWRHLPAHGPRRALRRDPEGRERVLPVRERARRRQRPEIVFKYYDDDYNPANTVPQTKKLVEQDHVFAVYGSLGTAPTLATRDYLNSQGCAAGARRDGRLVLGVQYKQYPWTIGFQPTIRVSRTSTGSSSPPRCRRRRSASSCRTTPTARTTTTASSRGLGDAKSKIVDVEKYDATQTDVSQQIVKLKAAGANVFALFALPTQTIDALVVATKIGWHPDDVHQQRLGVAVVHGPRAEERGQHRRRHLGDVPATTTSTTRTRPGRCCTSRSSPKYDAGADPNDAQQHLRHRERLDDREGPEAAGPNPTAPG